jgi:hypothetical protein
LLASAAGLLAVLLLAQLVLPAIAARIARERIAKYGTVRSVSVSALPAIQLLWGSAQSARIRAGSLRMSQAQADQMLPQLQGIDRVDMSAASFQVGALKLHAAQLAKRGNELYVQGTLEHSDLQSALPTGVDARPLASAQGSVEVLVSGSLLGVAASLRAVLSAQEGKLIAQPQGLPFAGLARITVYSDPRLYLQSFDLTILPGHGAEASYRVRLTATLH